MRLDLEYFRYVLQGWIFASQSFSMKNDKLYFWLKCQVNLERGLKLKDITTKLGNVPLREEEKEQ